MLTAIILAASLAASTPAASATDWLDKAIDHFHEIPSYRLTIRSIHDHGEIHVRYYYRQPGFVRMEFVHPHDGAVVIFSPDTGRVRLWPFGQGRFPEFNLSPDNPIIRSMSGIRVDRSDIGMLFRNIRALSKGGSAELLDTEQHDGKDVRHFKVTGATAQTVDGVHSSEVWLDARTLFPDKVVSRDLDGRIIETVVMEDAAVDTKLPDALFNP